MKKYKYKARDKTGKLVTGFVETTNEQIAARLIRQRGLVLIQLKPAYTGLDSILHKFSQRVSRGDITAFTRQFATMINAGLPITEALTILRTQAKSAFSSIVSQILLDVEGGESLSSAVKKHPKVFNPTYIALIKAGEAGGVLDKVLNRLADNLEREQEFRGKVKGALIYPAIIIVGMGVVTFIMVVFVIPRMLDLFTQFDAELPLPTKIMIFITDISQKLWPFFLVLLAAGIWGFTLYKRTKNGKRKIAEIMFKLPIIGDLQKEIILTELTRTLSLMVSSGVPILEGLNVTAGVINNIIIAEAVEDASKQIEKGFPIAFSFAKHSDAFPYILSQMIAVGEETGKMDEVLLKVSHVFEVDSEEKVKALTSAIEPVVMIILGIGVFFLVLTVILPIYSLTTSL